MTYLPDVNVWIALVAERSVHHDAARRWFAETEPEVLVFCRITQLGGLRLLTNRHVMQEEVLSPEVAWAAYRDLRKNPRIAFQGEPATLPEAWAGFTSRREASPNLWTDAYLAAFAEAGGFKLVTFDKKLPGQTGLKAVVLGATGL